MTIICAIYDEWKYSDNPQKMFAVLHIKMFVQVFNMFYQCKYKSVAQYIDHFSNAYIPCYYAS